jgi:hypothetical protein
MGKICVSLKTNYFIGGQKNWIYDHLIKAVNEMRQGLYEANLGGNIYKKRLSIGSRGKRGGIRTIVAFKAHDKVFFIYGFAKNKRDNITHKEEEVLKALAKVYFSYNENQINQAIKVDELIEVQS